MGVFGWFRKYIRKIGVFGVEVEFHPPTDVTVHKPTALPPSAVPADPVAVAPTTALPDRQPSQLVPGEMEGKTFEEVIQAIRVLHPDAPLGRTAEYGQYYERARGLANYQMYEDNPVCYVAIQPNGKVMWLYLGRGGKICCGDKE